MSLKDWTVVAAFFTLLQITLSTSSSLLIMFRGYSSLCLPSTSKVSHWVIQPSQRETFPNHPNCLELIKVDSGVVSKRLQRESCQKASPRIPNLLLPGRYFEVVIYLLFSVPSTHYHTAEQNGHNYLCGSIG